jgi:hypothetical protein
MSAARVEARLGGHKGGALVREHRLRGEELFGENLDRVANVAGGGHRMAPY